MNELSRIMLVSHILFCLIHDATAKPSAYGRSVSSTTISGVFCRIISHAFVPFDVQPTSSSSLLACIRRFVCFSRGSSAHASKIRILPCLIFIYCFPPAFSILCRFMDYILFLHIQRVRASGYPCFFPHIYRQFSTIPHFSVECPVFSLSGMDFALLCETT